MNHFPFTMLLRDSSHRRDSAANSRLGSGRGDESSPSGPSCAGLVASTTTLVTRCRTARRLLAGIGFVLGLLMAGASADEPTPDVESRVAPAASQSEAYSRARLLHEMVAGSLAVMHRDFFDEDDASAIPSASLEDVFHAMEATYDVEMKWLVVNTDVVNIDHEPETDFDHFAVKQLAVGKTFAERAESDRYRFAGAIHLRSQCLKCHVKRRTRNEDRTAGLIITMPMGRQPTANR